LLGKLGIGAAIAAVATLVAWGMSSWLLERAELATYDWRVRRTAQPTAPSPDIVMVSIDDDSVRHFTHIRFEIRHLEQHDGLCSCLTLID
jgi:CHASE2 domain-containing sensor protein